MNSKGQFSDGKDRLPGIFSDSIEHEKESDAETDTSSNEKTTVDIIEEKAGSGLGVEGEMIIVSMPDGADELQNKDTGVSGCLVGDVSFTSDGELSWPVYKRVKEEVDGSLEDPHAVNDAVNRWNEAA